MENKKIGGWLFYVEFHDTKMRVKNSILPALELDYTDIICIELESKIMGAMSAVKDIAEAAADQKMHVDTTYAIPVLQEKKKNGKRKRPLRAVIERQKFKKKYTQILDEVEKRGIKIAKRYDDKSEKIIEFTGI